MRRTSRIHSRRAFTLVEIMFAVGILAMIGVTIYRFTQSNLQAITLSVQDTEENLAVERLVALVQEELHAIDPRQQATLLGEGVKLSGVDLDSMRWRSRGGPGLMTTAASGDFEVTLAIQPPSRGARDYEIGLRRKPVLLDSSGALIQQAASVSSAEGDWVPLLPKAKSMRIRYWDHRLGQLLDSWRDQAARPRFIILSIELEGDTAPHEAVLALPASLTQG